MAGFGDIRLNNLVQEDAFEKIGDYIWFCCEEMKRDLCNKGEKVPNDENKIRNYLLEIYLDDTTNRRRNNMMMFKFMPESLENYDNTRMSYIGRVDIKVVNQNEWFENGQASYFVECKRLDGNKRLNDEYVVNGIERFVVEPLHYSSYFNKNYMLGLIIKDIKIDENIKKIEKIQNNNSKINNQRGLVQSKKGAYYDCEYNVSSRVIELRHMFADFSDIV